METRPERSEIWHLLCWRLGRSSRQRPLARGWEVGSWGLVQAVPLHTGQLPGGNSVSLSINWEENEIVLHVLSQFLLVSPDSTGLRVILSLLSADSLVGR